MKIHKVKFSSLYIILIILYCFYTYDLRPYFFWDTFDSGILGAFNRLPVRSLVGLLVILTGILCIKNQNNRSMWAFAIVIPIVVGFSLLNNDDYIISPNWLIPFATMVYLIASENIKTKSYVCFYNIFVILLIIPIVIYILVHIGVNVPYSILASHEDIKNSTGVFYKIYPLACQWSDPWNDAYRSLRMCGVYNEPGVVGTLCAMLLCAEDWQLRRNWKNIILLIGGIFSFSLAFYIIILVYVFWRAVNNNWKYTAAIIGVVVIYIVFINIKFNNPVIANFQSRLIITSTGLTGNNRTNIRYDSVYNTLNNDGLFSILFGKGFAAIEDTLAVNSIDGASYKNLIYDYGIIGFSIQIIWYFALSLFVSKGKNKKTRLFCIGMCLIMCANMYQRPTMYGFHYLVVMLGADYCYIKGIQASKHRIFGKKPIMIGGSNDASNKIRISTTRR